MTSKGIFPNTRTYNILINGYCKKEKVDAAIHLLEAMPLKGLTPTIETYSTILGGLFRMHRLDEAHKFYKKMLDQGVKLDTVTCGILLYGLCWSLEWTCWSSNVHVSQDGVMWLSS